MTTQIILNTFENYTKKSLSNRQITINIKPENIGFSGFFSVLI